jgi:hypothetical protein
MQSEQLQSVQTITIYKAPQKGKGQKLLDEGFQPVDFPYNPPYVDMSMEVATLQVQMTEVLPRNLTRATKMASLRFLLIRQTTINISNN